MSMYDLFNLSKRSHKDIFLLTPRPSDTFVYKASVIWNSVRQKLSILDTATPIGSIKSRLKTLIHTQQSLGGDWEWEDRNQMDT